MGMLGGYCETDEERAAIEQRDRDYIDAAQTAERIAELEAFLTRVEHIQTEWVTGMTSAQECMIALSEQWEKVRQR